MRRAGVYNRAIARGRAQGLEAGLAQLLHLSREEARTIAIELVTRIMRDRNLRRALEVRLAYLGTYGTAEQTRSILRLIPRVHESVSSVFAPLLSRHPELHPWIEKAKARFLQNQQPVLDHIVGEISVSGVHLQGGGHGLTIFETLAEKKLAAWTPHDLARFKRAIANLNPEQEREAIIAGFGDLGLDLSGDRWAKFLLEEQTHWQIAERQNGVRCFRVPRAFFNSHAWKNTISPARHGTSPIGGKSLFPARWGVSEIAHAIIAVLEHPEPFVLRRGTQNDAPTFYLRSRVNMVDVEVNVTGEGVATAFPSWRQYHPNTIAQAYKEWFSQHSTLQDLVDHCAGKEPLFCKLSFPSGIMQGYLGKIPMGISSEEWDMLEPWLSPKRLSEAQQRFDASALQLTIFEWMERSRVVQEFEGVEGAIR